MFYKSLFIALFLFLSLLQADYITEYKMGDEVQTFMYRDDSHSKLVSHSGGEKSEIYRIGKKVYIVSGSDGDKHIVDIDDMKSMAKSMGFDASGYVKDAKEEAKDYKIINTGKKVTVGGIRGELYTIKGNYDGKPYKQDIVMSNDKNVVKSVKAMFSLFSTMSTMDNSDDMFDVKKGYVTIKSDGMELKSFKRKSIANSEFELPKKAKKQEMPKPQTSRDSKEDVDKAIDMLKSFF
ncbi:hypothetical protein SMGD1_1266 [Sulfurimonas gotlandica GD1]|uniref:DUF4412 domain-containing protein n=1 Tax=Sulfurimonas gotlandica (strain DSM 19862 / JCM 16533 / GD1) TaxID=929558 RepID=B6BH06_SULGG|nr:hypothetical protein [Sulfurimonas gotlandica]EDZ62802.1 hypothetical protein CBGD1_420 [Sulfurimonas gotlandica GD1]EHP29790.1 hypothetical protein SMGD1_1266 [Sulfurimonas gotlandica GD1]